MDPHDPMNWVSMIPLKPFLEYCRSAAISEETIFNLCTAHTPGQLRHLQIVNVPHDNIQLAQAWNFLDIPLSIDLDYNMSFVPLFFSNSLP